MYIFGISLLAFLLLRRYCYTYTTLYTTYTIGIIGFGKFGQFLAKTFVKRNDVYAMSKEDKTVAAKELGKCV